MNISNKFSGIKTFNAFSEKHYFYEQSVKENVPPTNIRHAIV